MCTIVQPACCIINNNYFLFLLHMSDLQLSCGIFVKKTIRVGILFLFSTAVLFSRTLAVPFHWFIYFAACSFPNLIQASFSKLLYKNVMSYYRVFLFPALMLSPRVLSLSLPQHQLWWTLASHNLTTFIKTAGIIHKFLREIPKDVIPFSLLLFSLYSGLPVPLWWGLIFRLTLQE